MLEFISQIVDFVLVALKMVLNFLRSLVQIVMMIPQWLGFIGDMIGMLPSVLVAFAMLGILISVMLFVAGRN